MKRFVASQFHVKAGRRAIQGIAGIPQAELILDRDGERSIAEIVEEDAVGRQNAGGHHVTQAMKQIDKSRPALLGELFQGRGVPLQLPVMLRRIGKRPAQVLVRRWRENHDARLERSERVEQLVVALDKVRQARGASERFVHAVAEE